MSVKSKGWGGVRGAAGLVTGAMVLAPIPLSAGQAHSTIAVAVTVADYTRVTPLHQAGALFISTDDVARGYVDIPDAEGIAIKSNHPAGHRLVLEAHFPAARLTVMGEGMNANELPEGGGSIALPRRGNPATYEFGFRVYLARGTTPGVYNFPVSTFVEPI